MSDNAIRYDNVLRVMREVQARMAGPTLGPIIETPHARTPDRPVTWVTLPRPSRHRSRRVRKKPLKRSARPGVTWEPLTLVVNGATFAHPLVAAELRCRAPTDNPLLQGMWWPL